MRRSLATWLVVAAAAALMCLPSGCIGSRMGKKSSGDSWSRPSMFSWGKKKSSAELAQSKPTPPASNVAPGTSLAAGGTSQPFPAQPTSAGAPSGTPATYASTGASAYGAGSGTSAYGAAPNGQGTAGGQNSYVATSGGTAPQRGFYGDQYQGGEAAAPTSQYSSAGGYQDNYGGAPQSQNYEQVADQRGYGETSGGSQYGEAGGDSRYVSPQGQDQYDARNPAPSQYNDSYSNQYQGTSADSGYDNAGGGSQYSGGYENTAPQGGSSYGGASGGYTSPSGGAPVQSTSGAQRWLPGSTKQYNQQPLNPPTNSGYGSGAQY